ncbi:hypothetical protein AMTR_s00018p00070610 [Amborella trichopoda]|uniref:Uncharacterized protein n=1 Tax=Amborella trichopoda TaxID=13333 RepID=W1PK63_AMBTC|nr:hypothetical protein AMTR_s00018p00070610 [Amborella trichopoda]
MDETKLKPNKGGEEGRGTRAFQDHEEEWKGRVRGENFPSKNQTNLELVSPLMKQYSSTKKHCCVSIMAPRIYFSIQLALVFPFH